MFATCDYSNSRIRPCHFQVKSDDLEKSPRSVFARSLAERGDEAMTPLRTFYETIKSDDLVKSQKSRHSCESRSLELLEITGFPLSRE